MDESVPQVVLYPPVDVMRPRAVEAIPRQDGAPGGYQYSLKLDGFRALAFVLERGRVVLQSRSGRDLSPEFPQVADVLRERLAPGSVLDGEVCAHRDGRLSFTDLLRSRAERARSGVAVSYIAFDLLALPGRDLRALPLRERWELLGEALGDGAPPLQRVLATREEDVARGWFRDLRDAGVEGLVAKALDSPYRPRGGRPWQKIRHADTLDGVVLGLFGPAHRPEALLVGLPDGSRARTTPRLTAAQAREMGASAGERAGGLSQDPEHGAVRLLRDAPGGPLRVELRQAAGREGAGGAVRFVRVRGEG